MAIRMVFRRGLRPKYMDQVRRLGVDTVLAESDDDALAVIASADAYYGGITPALLEAARKLRWIQATSAGLDGFFFPALSESDVVVTNIRGVFSDVIADHVFSMVLAFARGLHHYVRHQASGKWQRGAPVVHMAGTTLGVVGLGGIGLAVAARGSAFGMRVLGADPAPKDTPGYVERIYEPAGLREMVCDSDFVVITVPHTPETDRLFDDGMIDAMKETAVLINVGRGKVVDLEALTEALGAGRLGGAGLDVFESEPLPAGHPLWEMENVVITPHVAGLSPEVPDRGKRLVVENVRRFCAGEPLLNVVDKKKGYVVDASSIWTGVT